MLQMLKHLNMKHNSRKNTRKTRTTVTAAQNPDGTQLPEPPQPAVPALNAEVTILLKYLSNVWRFHDLPSMNC